MKRALGVTLVELMLVIAIGSLMLLLSSRMYNSFRNESAVQGLRYNIDTLFLAASKYYQANCGLSATNQLSPTTPSPASINIATDLIATGYLTDKFPNANPLVDASADGQGYRVQFNQQIGQRKVYLDEARTMSKSIGSIVFWTIQIGVLLADGDKVEAYNHALNGSCATTVRSDGTMVPCTQAATFKAQCKLGLNAPPSSPEYQAAITNGCPTSGDQSYDNVIVFERLPSFASKNIDTMTAGGWLAKPELSMLMQAEQLSLSAQDGNNNQFFYCGG